MDNDKIEEKLQELLKKETYLEVINLFAESLMIALSVDEIIWCVTDNAISKMGYHDCVVYLFNEMTGKLVQTSAYGPKKTGTNSILNPIYITPGEGIVGHVFLSGKGEIIKDTTKDKRYITDDAFRYSEITIPIFYRDKVIGVIDAEHPEKDFFTKEDLKILTTISNMLSIKLEKAKENEKHQNILKQTVIDKTRELEQTNKILKEQNREKEVLLKEIHHRVKNNMQIIISLLNMQTNAAKTDYERMVFKECSDRMYSIANIHGKLYFEKNILRIPIKEFLYELVSALIISYYSEKIIDLELDINVYEVSLDTGIPLGLIINELVTNSIKQGFSEKSKGKVWISMIKKSDKFIVEYRDNGHGFEDNYSGDVFFGMELIEILVEQLDGEMIINEGTGMDLELSIPTLI